MGNLCSSGPAPRTVDAAEPAAPARTVMVSPARPLDATPAKTSDRSRPQPIGQTATGPAEAERVRGKRTAAFVSGMLLACCAAQPAAPSVPADLATNRPELRRRASALRRLPLTSSKASVLPACR